jgi:hypothetical protein
MMGLDKPSNEYVGDYMRQEGEYVKIFRRSKDPARADEQVVAIRLDKSQAVKEIS